MPTPDAGDLAKTCFVAMPITTPDAYAEKLGDPEHFTHVLTHLFTPAIQAAGLTVISPSVGGAEIIHAEIIRNLEQADFVLCDMSDLNPNVLFELGIRTSLDRPVMLVRDDLTSKIPFDLNAISTATYDSSLTPWSLAAEIPRLTSFIRGVVGRSNPGNAMWRYFGLTKRGTPSEAGSNPVEAKLDLIINELAKRDLPSIQSSVLERSKFEDGDITTALRSILAQHGVDDFKVRVIQQGGKGERILFVTLPNGLGPAKDAIASDVAESIVADLRNRGFGDIDMIWSTSKE